MSHSVIGSHGAIDDVGMSTVWHVSTTSPIPFYRISITQYWITVHSIVFNQFHSQFHENVCDEPTAWFMLVLSTGLANRFVSNLHQWHTALLNYRSEPLYRIHDWQVITITEKRSSILQINELNVMRNGLTSAIPELIPATCHATH